MKQGILLALLAGVLAAGCVSSSKKAPARAVEPPPPVPIEIYEIIDYKGKELGEELPPWVKRYLEGGARELEALPEYSGKYVFVSENSGTNDRVLRQWAGYFSVDQDFPRLAAARIEARFSRSSPANPDDEYGAFFAMMVRSSSDAFYGGAVREDDSWVLRRFFEDDGVTVEREEYGFLILSAMDKSLFQRRVNDILNGIVPDPPPTREQTAAIRGVMDSFFDGF